MGGIYGWVKENRGHKGRNSLDNLMPAARPEIDQLHLLGKWELPTKIAKKYSNYIAKVKKAKEI